MKILAVIVIFQLRATSELSVAARQAERENWNSYEGACQLYFLKISLSDIHTFIVAVVVVFGHTYKAE